MKTILVPASGGSSDEVVFQTALLAARPFDAHLEFIHVSIDAVEAARYRPHVEFARGRAMTDALGRLHMESEQRSADALRHVKDFCQLNAIELCDRPGAGRVTGSWRQESDNATQCLMLRARHNDLVVAARKSGPDGLPDDFLELLLLGSGRPLLVAGSSAPRTLTGTVMVCWKESAEAARAMTAAMPLLSKSDRVVFVTVPETGNGEADTVRELVRQAAWHGIEASALVVASNGRSAADALRGAAQSCGADLIVMGGYGHRRMREIVFGGCTQSVLASADRPVFLVH